MKGVLLPREQSSHPFEATISFLVDFLFEFLDLLLPDRKHFLSRYDLAFVGRLAAGKGQKPEQAQQAEYHRGCDGTHFALKTEVAADLAPSTVETEKTADGDKTSSPD